MEDATSRITGKHPFFWFVLGYTVLFAALLIFVCGVTYRFGTAQRERGWDCSFQSNRCYARVDPKGPAAGKLKSGDLILAVNGNTAFSAYTIHDQKIAMIPGGGAYRLSILRNSTKMDLDLASSETTNIKFVFPVLVILLAALIHAVVSAFVGLSRPAVKTVRLFSMAGLSLALSILAYSLSRLEEFSGFRELRVSFLCMLLSFAPMAIPLAFHFYARFPAEFPEKKIWNYSKKLLYTFAAVIAACFTAFRSLMIIDPVRGSGFGFQNSEQLVNLRQFSNFTGLCAFVAVCCVLLQNYKALGDWNQRRRIRWVFYGGLLGILPLGMYFLGNMLRQQRLPFAPSQAALDSLFPFVILFLVLVPLTVSYAILKNRIFNIQLVVRRGVQYLFAKRSLQALIYLPGAFIVYRIRSNPNRRIFDLLFNNTWYLLLVMAGLCAFFFRKTILDWLDRRFFREAYDSEKILIALVEEIKNFNSISEVAKWVSLQLESALHPGRIVVFYKQKGRKNFSLAYSSGSGANANLQIPDSFRSMMIAEGQAKSLNISSNELQLAEEEKNWMREAGIHLLVPMLGGDEFLYGFLLLGEKKSEEPYSTNDRKLLESLARQMAVLYENLLLKDQVVEDHRIQRDVLAQLSGQSRNVMKECPECGTCYDEKEEKCELDQAELVLTLPVERVIEGKYRLERLLGRGGMGAVYQGTDVGLNREVAVKLMLAAKFGDTQALKRFIREARASARLNHPNVVSVHDFGEIRGGGYIVMELVRGYSMREAITKWGPIRPEIAAGWFDQILQGVKAAHLRGIIHRDLKPENVVITRDGKNQPLVKILDFGLAKIAFSDDVTPNTLTEPGTVLGTLSYMSPEQISGGTVDERTDIFALGVMAVEALTGELPFTGMSAQEVALAILQKPVELKTDTPERKHLNAVIQKCVAKNRNSRFSTIDEMQKELIEAIRKVPPFPSNRTRGLKPSPDTPTEEII